MILDDILDIEARLRKQRSEVWSVSSEHSQFRRWGTMCGAPGAGKTTLLGRLAERHPTLRVSESSLPEVADQTSRLGDYFQRAFNGEKGYFLHFQIEMLVKRIEQSLIVSHSGGIVDGSICSTYAYSRALLATGRLTSNEYCTFYSWYLVARSILGYPSHVVYCRCSTPELRRRILMRSRPHEAQRYTDEYLDALNVSFATIAADYRRQATVTEIDTELFRLPDTESERQLISQCFVLRGEPGV